VPTTPTPTPLGSLVTHRRERVGVSVVLRTGRNQGGLHLWAPKFGDPVSCAMVANRGGLHLWAPKFGDPVSCAMVANRGGLHPTGNSVSSFGPARWSQAEVVCTLGAGIPAPRFPARWSQTGVVCNSQGSTPVDPSPAHWSQTGVVCNVSSSTAPSSEPTPRAAESEATQSTATRNPVPRCRLPTLDPPNQTDGMD
jgi:hypothetical protein